MHPIDWALLQAHNTKQVTYEAADNASDKARHNACCLADWLPRESLLPLLLLLLNSCDVIPPTYMCGRLARALIEVLRALQAHELGQRGAQKMDQARATVADKIAPN